MRRICVCLNYYEVQVELLIFIVNNTYSIHPFGIKDNATFLATLAAAYPLLLTVTLGKKYVIRCTTIPVVRARFAEIKICQCKFPCNVAGSQEGKK